MLLRLDAQKEARQLDAMHTELETHQEHAHLSILQREKKSRPLQASRETEGDQS